MLLLRFLKLERHHFGSMVTSRTMENLGVKQRMKSIRTVLRTSLLFLALLLVLFLFGCGSQQASSIPPSSITDINAEFAAFTQNNYSWERPADEVQPLLDAILALPLSENAESPESPTALRLEYGEITILFDAQLSFINVLEQDVYRGCSPDAEQAVPLFPLVQAQTDGILFEMEGTRRFLSKQISGDLFAMLEQHDAAADANLQFGSSSNVLYYGLNSYHLTDPISDYAYAYRNGQSVSFRLSAEELALVNSYYRTAADETESLT